MIIIGGGPVGNLHTQMMRLIGAAPILVMERAPVRAKKAKAAGADAVAGDEAEMLQLIDQYIDGRGADFVIESVGLAETYRLASQFVRPGGQICAFGLAAEQETLCLNLLETVLNENGVKGSVAGMGPDMHDAAHLIANRRFDLTDFLQLDYSLADIQTAFEEFNKDTGLLKSAIRLTR